MRAFVGEELKVKENTMDCFKSTNFTRNKL